MEVTVIDRAAWARREYFEHYLTSVPCTVSMTTQLEIAPLRRSGRRLYPAMLHLLAQTVNEHEQFRMALRGEELVRYGSMTPYYTVFHKQSGSFSNLWTDYAEDYGEFLARFEEDQRRYGASEGFSPKPGLPENYFTVSMLPWRGFTAFQVNTPDYRYLRPIFTMGRMEESEGSCKLPLAVQVHHAVCDGFHLCAFLDGLQQKIDRLAAPPVRPEGRITP